MHQDRAQMHDSNAMASTRQHMTRIMGNGSLLRISSL